MMLTYLIYYLTSLACDPHTNQNKSRRLSLIVFIIPLKAEQHDLTLTNSIRMKVCFVMERNSDTIVQLLSLVVKHCEGVGCLVNHLTRTAHGYTDSLASYWSGVSHQGLRLVHHESRRAHDTFPVTGKRRSGIRERNLGEGHGGYESVGNCQW